MNSNKNFIGDTKNILSDENTNYLSEFFVSISWILSYFVKKCFFRVKSVLGDINS